MLNLGADHEHGEQHLLIKISQQADHLDFFQTLTQPSFADNTIPILHVFVVIHICYILGIFKSGLANTHHADAYDLCSQTGLVRSGGKHSVSRSFSVRPPVVRLNLRAAQLLIAAVHVMLRRLTTSS